LLPSSVKIKISFIITHRPRTKKKMFEGDYRTKTYLEKNTDFSLKGLLSYGLSMLAIDTCVELIFFVCLFRSLPGPLPPTSHGPATGRRIQQSSPNPSAGHETPAADETLHVAAKTAHVTAKTAHVAAQTAHVTAKTANVAAKTLHVTAERATRLSS
jgi:hypothetical protein